MAIYDGATVRIKATVTDFDENAIPAVNISAAVVSLYDSAGNYVFNRQVMSWNPTLGYWYYDWQDALPGTFTSEYEFNGTNFEAIEFGKVTVKPLKVTPTGNPTPIVGSEDLNGG